MRRKTVQRLLAVLSILALLATVTACAKLTQNKDTPLVVGYSEFSEKFSPFFAIFPRKH